MASTFFGRSHLGQSKLYVVFVYGIFFLDLISFNVVINLSYASIAIMRCKAF